MAFIVTTQGTDRILNNSVGSGFDPRKGVGDGDKIYQASCTTGPAAGPEADVRVERKREEKRAVSGFESS